jgi:hypothetical protein
MFPFAKKQWGRGSPPIVGKGSEIDFQGDRLGVEKKKIFRLFILLLIIKHINIIAYLLSNMMSINMSKVLKLNIL